MVYDTLSFGLRDFRHIFALLFQFRIDGQRKIQPLMETNLQSFKIISSSHILRFISFPLIIFQRSTKVNFLLGPQIQYKWPGALSPSLGLPEVN